MFLLKINTYKRAHTHHTHTHSHTPDHTVVVKAHVFFQALVRQPGSVFRPGRGGEHP